MHTSSRELTGFSGAGTFWCIIIGRARIHCTELYTYSLPQRKIAILYTTLYRVEVLLAASLTIT